MCSGISYHIEKAETQNFTPLHSIAPRFPPFPGLALPTFTSRLFQSVSVSSLSAETDPAELTDDLLVPNANIFWCLPQVDFSATLNTVKHSFIYSLI